MADITRRGAALLSAGAAAGLLSCSNGVPGGGGGSGGGGGGNAGGGSGGGTPGGGGSGALRTRRDASFAGAGDLTAYAEAVRRMRALPASDPRSWEAQARIHFDQCPHGNWWFLPWHRAYLAHFEQICGAMIGDSNFTLPYWNWSRNPSLPAAFTSPSSPLFSPGRVATAGARATTEMVSAAAVESQTMTAQSFELFGGGRASSIRQSATMGPLEAGPHNHIHVFVGGTMSTFFAARDPIFWLHHANVDRLWDVWTARGNANSAESAWLNERFAGFRDGSGRAVSTRCADVLNTQSLGYRYESLGVAEIESETPSLGFGRPMERAFATPVRRPTSQLGGGYGARRVYSQVNTAPCLPGRVSAVQIPAPAQMRPPSGARPGAQTTAGFAPASVTTDRVIVNIADIEGPQNENILVRVFVNCPYLTPRTPTSDPHYVGSFSFFATRYVTSVCSPGGEIGVTLDATAALAQAGASANGIQVQLAPIAISGRGVAGAEFYARRVEVALF